MTRKPRKTPSSSKSSRLAEDTTILSFAYPKEWERQVRAICGHGKRYETKSALMRHLLAGFLGAADQPVLPQAVADFKPAKTAR